ncbi:MAG: Mur ligase family protein [Desulfonauticus sp.]|nr:Mur ligase family protein [Desulfonauticus sp.]
MFKTFQDINNYLNQLGLFKMDLGLEKVQKALEQLNIPLNFTFIVHIVGTNGKGSTAHFLEHLARKHGLKTGLFTSPHLVSIKERITVNNCQLSDQLWIQYANSTLQHCSNLSLTYFEFLFIISCLAFKEQKVDIAFFEAGLGGKFDATNVLKPNLTLFTSIGLDHTDILGNTLIKISIDKAGAIKDAPVISAFQKKQVLMVLKKTAGEQSTPFIYSPQAIKIEQNRLILLEKKQTIRLSLYLACFQKYNLPLIVTCWQEIVKSLNLPFCIKKIETILNSTFIPGRLQQVQTNPDVYLDVGHNPEGIKLLKQALFQLHIQPQTIVFSCLKDKDLFGIYKELKEISEDILFCPLDLSQRGLSLKDLQKLISDLKTLSSFEQVIDLLDKQKSILFCGSFYLLARLFKLYPNWLGKNLLNQNTSLSP